MSEQSTTSDIFFRRMRARILASNGSIFSADLRRLWDRASPEVKWEAIGICLERRVREGLARILEVA